MNNNRPLSKRKTVQLLVILTIMAWATQTLLHQWGFGAEVTPTAPPVAAPEAIGAEKFVPGSSSVGGTLEMRGEATVLGAEVKLKQICRWSDAQAGVFASLGDVPILKIPVSTSFRSISVQEVKQSLHDAGVNVAMINFVGPTACTVTRSDAQADEHEALKQWIDQQSPAAKSADAPATRPAPVVAEQALANKLDKPAVRSLRDLLTADACERLAISPDSIQVTFSPEDEKVLALAEPYFKFDVQPSRVHNLGPVSWDVAIVTEAATKKVSISATARAWQTQVMVVKPLAFKKVLEDTDFTEKRVLVDQIPDQVLLKREQCVGQEAALELKPGTIMTARMVDAIPLVRSGQPVTLTLTQGTVQIRAVGVALEEGSIGQSIKVRNESTREVFDATVTGVQEARLGGKPAGNDVASTGG